MSRSLGGALSDHSERRPAIRRPHDPVRRPQRRELRRQKLDTPPAVTPALAQELSRQVGSGRLEQLVDPVVDLTEEAGALAGAHAESMLLCDSDYNVEGLPAYGRFTRGEMRPLGSLKREVGMELTIGDTAPDFEAQTTEGTIHFHDWIGDSWVVLFSHPKDFTPVCTTELGYMASIKPEFDKRNVKIIGLSVDAAEDHEKWAKDIEETQGTAPNYPLIGDPYLTVAKLYGMLPAGLEGEAQGRTPADNQTVRNVFVIGPDKKIKLILVYPMTTGRNFDEVLRVIDSLQLTASHKVSTPAQWQPGDDVIIAGSVSNDEAKELFGEWEEPKPYIRIVPDPSKVPA
jgi:alkyl hydroperoxide reductase subunit AhpC